MQGDWDQSRKTFSSMISAGKKPISLTFTHLLTAASHSGKVKEAETIFLSMEKKFGVTPSLFHANLVVDTLARAGHLAESVQFIKQYIPEPSIQLISSLCLV